MPGEVLSLPLGRGVPRRDGDAGGVMEAPRKSSLCRCVRWFASCSRAAVFSLATMRWTRSEIPRLVGACGGSFAGGDDGRDIPDDGDLGIRWFWFLFSGSAPTVLAALEPVHHLPSLWLIRCCDGVPAFCSLVNPHDENSLANPRAGPRAIVFLVAACTSVFLAFLAWGRSFSSCSCPVRRCTRWMSRAR